MHASGCPAVSEPLWVNSSTARPYVPRGPEKKKGSLDTCKVFTRSDRSRTVGSRKGKPGSVLSARFLPRATIRGPSPLRQWRVASFGASAWGAAKRCTAKCSQRRPNNRGNRLSSVCTVAGWPIGSLGRSVDAGCSRRCSVERDGFATSAQIPG